MISSQKQCRHLQGPDLGICQSPRFGMDELYHKMLHVFRFQILLFSNRFSRYLTLKQNLTPRKYALIPMAKYTGVDNPKLHYYRCEFFGSVGHNVSEIQLLSSYCTILCFFFFFIYLTCLYAREKPFLLYQYISNWKIIKPG